MNGDINYSIRTGRAEDIPQIVGLVDKLLCELNHKKLELDHDIMGRICAELLSDHNHNVFLAFNGDQAVGMAGIVQSIAIYTLGPFGVLNELYVLPEYRSLGVGKLLIAAITEYGENKGWARIEVGLPEQGLFQRTFDFYQREGFEEIGPRVKKYLSHNLRHD
jgi:GNAT superfamily N-acetyltransferase